MAEADHRVRLHWGSGSTTAHSVALDDWLVEGCFGDGDRFTALEGGLFELWRRAQARWDAVH